MAYNLASVRANVRDRLDDEDFEQTYLDRAINYAQWEITNKHHLSIMEASTNLSVISNDIDTPVPTDYHKALYLRITSPANNRVDITDMYMDYGDFVTQYIDPSVNEQGMPYRWSEYGRRFKYAQPADQAYTLKLDYLRKSPMLDDDADVPDIPEEFQELLELGAYMRIAKREDDYDVKRQEEVDYARLLTDFIHVYGRKQGPRGIRKMRVR